ncbi:MAG: phosphatase PAP2 family protein [Candidatus Cloacimonadaceae bacterium]
MSTANILSEPTARKSRRYLLNWDFLLPLLLFTVTVLIFRFTELDLKFQSLFYRSGTGWYLKNLPLIRILYNYGNLPALLLALCGVILFGLSFFTVKYIKWRKIGIFLVLVMLIGPGLIINLTLKDHWGRPRPRNVIEFGGKYNFEEILSVDLSSPGKSFPSGHASMGFYLLTPWFLLRKKRQRWAAFFLFIGLTFGLLMGWARIAQGGHWLSDVITSGILVYLTAAAVFYLLKLNSAPFYLPQTQVISSGQRLVAVSIIIVLLIFLLLGVSLAAPYEMKRSYLSSLPDKNAPFRLLEMNVADGDIMLKPKPDIQISFDTQGFGFPGCKLITSFKEEMHSDTLAVVFSQSKKGIFSELNNTIMCGFPFEKSGKVKLHLNDGNAVIALPENSDTLALDIFINKGTLDLDLPSSFKPRITLKGDCELIDKTGFTSSDKVYINEDFNVYIAVAKGKVILR